MREQFWIWPSFFSKSDIKNINNEFNSLDYHVYFDKPLFYIDYNKTSIIKFS